MTRVKRISQVPGSTLRVHLNLRQPDGSVQVETLEAAPATAEGPQFETVLGPEAVAILQEDPRLAAHFVFDPVEDSGRRRRATGETPSTT